MSVAVACARDCLYVATLDRRRRPRGRREARVAQRRRRRATITLPKTKLGQATYTIDVRLVSRVNPGRVLQLASPPLARG